MDTPKEWKLDVIVPTADENSWPAKESLEWNMSRASVYYNIRFNPIVSSGDNFSFAKSVNKGIRESREDSDILLLNDDCFLDRGWAVRFWAAKKSHPECGLFGALLRFPTKDDMKMHHNPGYLNPDYGDMYSGRKAINHVYSIYQHAGGFIPVTKQEVFYAMIRWAIWYKAPVWALKSLYDMMANNDSVFPGHHHHMRRENKLHLVTAASMVITRKTINFLGDFDEHFKMAFEDTDYCLRALLNDIYPCLVSDATGSHYESLTSRHLENKKRESYKTFLEHWAIGDIQLAINNKNGITHPAFCGCKDGYE